MYDYCLFDSVPCLVCVLFVGDWWSSLFVVVCCFVFVVDYCLLLLSVVVC